MENRTNVTKDSSRNVCVQIFDLKSENIDPTRPLILELLVLSNSEGKLGCKMKLNMTVTDICTVPLKEFLNLLWIKSVLIPKIQ